jgi:predicted RNA-binding Zn-ribbon protein involved in translation (DUF1610 family)
MAKEASMRAFKCPSCGAPLEPEVDSLTMKCPYCGGTVIIPESLRTSSRPAGPTMGEVFDFGLKGVDLNQIVGNAMHLPQAISLAQQGKIDEAADIYSQITGMQHADAVESVKAMAAGRAVSLTPGRPGATWGQAETSYQRSNVQVSTPSTFNPTSFTTGPSTAKSSGGGRSCGLLVGIIAAVAVLIFVLLGGGLALFSSFNSSASIVPAGFATQKLSFGSEGIGPGMFEDPRHIGVDANGNMTVADYQDGRIQIFGPDGKLLNGFSISPDGKKVYIDGLTVGRNGDIYIAHNQKIFIYDASGKQAGEIGDDTHDYSDVTFGGDGKLYAVANNENIVRFNPDYTIDLEVPNTFSTATDQTELESYLAVDGLGNMYIVGAFNYLVLKFSPQGKFLNRFGGHDESSNEDSVGKFTTPRSIAIDGYGRVYVGDFFDIKVFDADGAYLNKIDMMGSGVPFGVAVDGQNSVYAVTSDKKVLKFEVQKPNSQ